MVLPLVKEVRSSTTQGQLAGGQAIPGRCQGAACQLQGGIQDDSFLLFSKGVHSPENAMVQGDFLQKKTRSTCYRIV